ncbi:hypothetical protein P12x_002509 [Tundrisphaera lichenicola]|uniref:hypothetical protein n=1 Tax=Tundrisphaera lichenicola TaxID=2029860 RepID=UPI003EB7517C
MSGPTRPKGTRLAEFYRRLQAAPAASSAAEAYQQVCDILNAVEDDLTGIPFDPSLWMTDGRMYPAQADSVRSVPGHPNLIRYASRGHDVVVASNGAIQIRVRGGSVAMDKPGADGGRIS